MERITHALIKTGKNKEKDNMVWNMIGSFCYAFASMVLAFLVMRIVGEEQGGIFSFGFSTFGQQMFIVAYFGIRPFQVTDGNHEYSFGDYRRFRMVTCGGAIVIGMAYLVFQVVREDGYSIERAVILLLLVLYKVVDGFADVYESEFQRNGNLHLTGKSNAFRTLLSVGCFLASLLLTKDLLLSCVTAVVAQVVGFLIFDAQVIRYLPDIDWNQGRGRSKALCQSTSLLFVSAFLDFYIFSAAKYAIDGNLSDAYSGYFNMIFMPTSVINLVAGFVIRPFLTSLTAFWTHQRFDEFRGQFFKLLSVILGLSFLAVGGAVVLGGPVLHVLELALGPVYQGKLVGYHSSFVLIVLGGGFYAVLSLMYYSLVIMRKQGAIFAVYAVACGAALGLSNYLVRLYGIWGASCAYLAVMVILAAGFGILTVCSFRKEKMIYGR